MRWRAWLFLALAALPALAAGAPVTPEAIDALMHKSGLWTQLAGISTQFARSFDNSARPGALDERSLATLRMAVDTAYGAERMRKSVARTLAKEMSAEDTAAALAWLDTDLGKRITRLEEDASKDAPPERSADIAAALPPERRELYLRMARAIHSGEVGATIVINIAVAVARGAAGSGGKVSPENEERLRAMLESGRPRLVAAIEMESVGSSAVIYATLTDKEVEAYIDFTESPAGARYSAATSIAIERAMTEAATEVGRSLATGDST